MVVLVLVKLFKARGAQFLRRWLVCLGPAGFLWMRMRWQALGGREGTRLKVGFCHVLPLSGFYLGLRETEVPPSMKEVLHSGYLAALRVGGVRFRGPSRHRLRTALRIGGDHPERKETLRTGGKALRRGGASDEASARRCLRKGVLVPSE